MKYILASITMIFFFTSILNCYSQESLDNRYLVALIYLKTNKEINKEIKKTFPYLTKKRDKIIEFNLSDQIEFLPLYFFHEQLKQKNFSIGIETELIENRDLYKSRYGFDTYTNKLLSNLIQTSDSKLILKFSKPIGSYVLAEMLDSTLNIVEKFKFGNAIQFFFEFNEDGLIKDVLHSAVIYN